MISPENLEMEQRRNRENSVKREREREREREGEREFQGENNTMCYEESCEAIEAAIPLITELFRLTSS